MECHVKAQSEPNVLWYKEQTVVQKSSKHTVHINKVSEVTVRKNPKKFQKINKMAAKLIFLNRANLLFSLKSRKPNKVIVVSIS